ncbi:class A beta-lactamase [Salinicoccus halodurans]|uniref:Beta-lactamase n=1 Tax=Salinicoccus halodurans TaxID=407035 RepID=A0A0F7HJ33_9STAP|nr:class A beta-lactamase [Salinicoccus halodurans]AKG73018.1 beta-lactamase [Salinicoccus halodurans]SFK77523.1 beta-lactamase class A [Salinicoccus halodurans]
MKRNTVVTAAFILAAIMLMGCSDKGENKAEGQETKKNTDDAMGQIEKEYDANLGVYALDTGSGQTVSYNADERFAYASTHKALAAGVLLQQNDIEELGRTVEISEADLVNYNPVTEDYVGEAMTLEQLAEASLHYSDNTAGNLILEEIGGPEGFKRALRDMGDDVTNPVRSEPNLNEFIPDDPSDTSTPRALTSSLKSLTVGDALPGEKQKLLIDWLKGNQTGDTLIRAGLPENWEVGDRTGAATYGTRNAIAVIRPPGGEPIFLAVLSNKDKKDAEYDDELIQRATEETIKALEQ